MCVCVCIVIHLIYVNNLRAVDYFNKNILIRGETKLRCTSTFLQASKSVATSFFLFSFWVDK